LAVSVARVIWRDSLSKIADTKIIGIDTQWFIWYNLNLVPRVFALGELNTLVWAGHVPRSKFSARGGVGKVSNYMIPVEIFCLINS
jgi:hypothetical protein